MSALRTLDDILDDVKGRRVFVRVDFNVPLDGGRVMDATRIKEALPTIRELLGAGAKVVLASHCGRPKGQVKPEMSLRPAAEKLAELLGQTVPFAQDCIGDPARQTVKKLGAGEVAVLENLRFHAGETKNDAEFADALAELADVYVDDAFGTAHRAHASTFGVADRVEIKAAGRLLVREVEALSSLLGQPAKPFVGVLGGAKIEGKLDTLENLLPRLDVLLLGGGMANTFLVARGHDVAKSLYEPERVNLAKEIMARADEANTEIILPADVIVADSLDDPTLILSLPLITDPAPNAIPEGRMALDIGELARKRFGEVCRSAGTLFWNGPLGVFERPPFDDGTQAVAESLGECPGFTVIGGGETVAAVHRAGVADKLSHVSTGGGASLELLAGKKLPGVAALEVES